MLLAHHRFLLPCIIPYNELSEEEKRGRRHKNKVVLEAERQAKAALDKVEKYAVIATIDKQELTFPLLNIKTPVQEAMVAVKKELAIPIPALIGQKTWREERTTNINDAIKALVTSFRSLTTCRAVQIHTSHSVAPMVVLTNSLIGTEHRSWG